MQAPLTEMGNPFQPFANNNIGPGELPNTAVLVNITPSMPSGSQAVTGPLGIPAFPSPYPLGSWDYYSAKATLAPGGTCGMWDALDLKAGNWASCSRGPWQIPTSADPSSGSINSA